MPCPPRRDDEDAAGASDTAGLGGRLFDTRRGGESASARGFFHICLTGLARCRLEGEVVILGGRCESSVSRELDMGLIVLDCSLG
jgi:hypothetical protein